MFKEQYLKIEALDVSMNTKRNYKTGETSNINENHKAITNE